MSEYEFGRVRPPGMKEGDICFSNCVYDSDAFFTFAPPEGGAGRVVESNGWVREADHIIACDNKEGHYIRLNRRDALDLAKWLLNVASEMDENEDS